MPTKQWFQVEVGNEIRDRNTFSVIFHIQPRFQVAVRVPNEANSGSVYWP